MSDDDRKKWKAKYIGGKYPRVEIRKTFTTRHHVQAVIVVSPTGKPLGKMNLGRLRARFWQRNQHQDVDERQRSYDVRRVRQPVGRHQRSAASTGEKVM